jgi:hypothetical protein
MKQNEHSTELRIHTGTMLEKPLRDKLVEYANQNGWTISKAVSVILEVYFESGKPESESYEQRNKQKATALLKGEANG